MGHRHVEKKCSQCEERKPTTEFYRSGNGWDRYCKRCRRIRDRKRQKQKRLRYDPNKTRSYKLKTLYGITLEDYERMLKKQDGVCRICLLPEVRSAYGEQPRLCVDHNHMTGEVRGLLCAGCNKAVGLIENDQLVRRIYEYLETHDSFYSPAGENRLR